MNVDTKIEELANLYRAARAANDPYLLPLAEAAMAHFTQAEAAMTQMNVTQQLVAKSLETQ